MTLVLLLACADDPSGPARTTTTTTPTTTTTTTTPPPTTDGDSDGDGFEPPEDCDDGDDTVFPGADEVAYDGIDQDCADGDLVDVDGDGHDAVEVGGDDCDDADPDAAPGELDRAGDGVDQSCDGVDGMDADLDGFASVASFGDDCDDGDPAVNPGAAEIWYDAADQDCDGGCDGDQDGDGAVLDGWGVLDGDACDADPAPGVAWAQTDCDDLNPAASVEALAFSPVDGAVAVSPLRGVRAWLYAVDPTAVLTLADASGTAVPGTSSWSATMIELVPTVALDPSTTYTATLTSACGAESWSFSTGDGVAQEIFHQWTPGAPDLLLLDVANPVATRFGFGLAETAAGVVGWYGEDCAGPLAYGSCHLVTPPDLVLESVYPMLGAVVIGQTTLFDATFDPAITWYLEALDGAQAGACWTWGHDPAYFGWCTAT